VRSKAHLLGSVAVFTGLLIGGLVFMWLIALGCAVGGDFRSDATWLCDPDTGAQTAGWGKSRPVVAAALAGCVGVV